MKSEIGEEIFKGMTRRLLMQIYHKLYKAYGPMHWWPGETPFEVMVGAILTQNTSWRNVEKAIKNLKKRGVLDIAGIRKLSRQELATLIRSSGFFRIKAERLKSFVDFIVREYNGDLKKMKREKLEVLRPKLLQVKGVGPETADSILLYGLNKPIFVVDAYTKRVLSRHGVISEKASYEEVQRCFMDRLPHQEELFNEYHALLVHLAKTACKKNKECETCPLKRIAHGNKKVEVKVKI